MDTDLIAAARKAREHAYAPYSGYTVGAAVRTASGKLFSGANVENASYGLTVCAERVAIQAAVSQGEHDITALAVITGDGASPCGACRQVLHEFSRDAKIFIGDAAGAHRETTLAALLPEAFDTKTKQDGNPD